MRSTFILVAVCSLVGSGCGAGGDETVADETVADETVADETVADEQTLRMLEHLSELSRVGGVGAPLPGTDPMMFQRAAEAFGQVKTIEDGLGPTFNEAACGNCHTTPVRGGAGVQIERRFGRHVGGIFFGFDEDEENQGGTLRQLFSNGEYLNDGVACSIPLDIEPTEANVSNVGRRTTPLFGLGLVDAMPDSFFDALAALQPVSTRGVVQRVPVVLPDPRGTRQGIGSLRVGRFGWKGLILTLLVFSGDALDVEMGVTTQSCFKGTSILEFAVENHPNNIPPPPGCNDGDRAPPQPAGDPQVPEFTDEAVGNCSRGRTEIQGDLILLTTFVERLAPPPPRITDPVAFVRGAFQFARVGCASCHVPIIVTPASPFNGVPGSYPFAPFSDFLAHDMGALGDGLALSGDSVSKTRLMRTSPLWGARFNASFLHDGRANTIREAILFHDGQGAGARARFERLRSNQQEDLIQFVLSL